MAQKDGNSSLWVARQVDVDVGVSFGICPKGQVSDEENKTKHTTPKTTRIQPSVGR